MSIWFNDNYDGITITSPGRAKLHGALNRSHFNLSTTMTSPQQTTCDINSTGLTKNILYASFMILILLASLIGNSLVVVATVLSKQLRKGITIYFIMSLAIADLVYACCLIPFTISMKLYGNMFCHSLTTCFWFIATDSFSNLACILSLFLIAIDRFIAIKKPFRYAFILPLTRAKKLIAGIWIFSFVWAIVGLFKWSTEKDHSNGIFSVVMDRVVIACYNSNRYYYFASFLGLYLVPLVVMTFTYLMILQIALVHIRAIESTTVELKPQMNVDVSPLNIGDRKHTITADSILQTRTRNRKRRKEIKATKSVAIVYFTFLICWLPNCIISIIIMFNKTYFPQLRKNNETLFFFVYYTFTQILPMLNTMLNPIIYSFSNKQFQKAFLSVFKRMCGKFDSPNNSFDSVSRRITPIHDIVGIVSSSTSTSIQSGSIQSPQSGHRVKWSPGKDKKVVIENTYNDGNENGNVNTKLVK